jgi:hypothetical protein
MIGSGRERKKLQNKRATTAEEVTPLRDPYFSSKNILIKKKKKNKKTNLFLYCTNQQCDWFLLLLLATTSRGRNCAPAQQRDPP